jgi:hypothetical protein
MATAGGMKILAVCSATTGVTFELHATSVGAIVLATLGSPPQTHGVGADAGTSTVIETTQQDRIDFDGYDAVGDTMDGQLFGNAFGTTGCVVAAAVTVNPPSSSAAASKATARRLLPIAHGLIAKR